MNPALNVLTAKALVASARRVTDTFYNNALETADQVAANINCALGDRRYQLRRHNSNGVVYGKMISTGL